MLSSRIHHAQLYKNRWAALMIGRALTQVFLTLPCTYLSSMHISRGIHLTHHLVNISQGETHSLEECARSCASLGYAMIGLTGHYTPPAPLVAYCYCGHTINAAAVSVPESNCALPCPLNKSEICGGNYFLSVYNATCSAEPPLPSGPACSQPQAAAWPFCNVSLPLATRVADLVARIYASEAGPLLTARKSIAIPRLVLRFLTTCYYILTIS